MQVKCAKAYKRPSLNLALKAGNGRFYPRRLIRLRLDLLAKTVQEIHQLLCIFQVGHVITFAHLNILAFHIRPVPLSRDDNRRPAGEFCALAYAPPHVKELVYRQIDLVEQN